MIDINDVSRLTPYGVFVLGKWGTKVEEPSISPRVGPVSDHLSKLPNKAVFLLLLQGIVLAEQLAVGRAIMTKIRMLGKMGAISLAIITVSVSADWSINSSPNQAGVPQDIVIELKQNPMAQPEVACLAVTLARSLSSGDPTANITLFTMLDGVALGDDAVVSNRRFRCNTPWGELSLRENLEAFLAGNPNNLVVCPPCWIERYGDQQQPDYGVLDSSAVGATLLNAEKVIDF